MDEIKTLLENVLSKTSDMKQAFIDLAPNSRMNMGNYWCNDHCWECCLHCLD